MLVAHIKKRKKIYIIQAEQGLAELRVVLPSQSERTLQQVWPEKLVKCRGGQAVEACPARIVPASASQPVP